MTETKPPSTEATDDLDLQAGGRGMSLDEIAERYPEQIRAALRIADGLAADLAKSTAALAVRGDRWLVEGALGSRVVVTHPAQQLAVEAFKSELERAVEKGAIELEPCPHCGTPNVQLPDGTRTEQTLTPEAVKVGDEWVPRERIITPEERAVLDAMAALDIEVLKAIREGWSYAPLIFHPPCLAELARREAKP